MLKKTIMSLAIAAVAATSLSANAMAGKWGGKHKGSFPWELATPYSGKKVYAPRYSGPSCYHYKKKYKWTGKHYWLKKYKACLVLYH